MMERGIVNQHQIGAAFGVSHVTISLDMKRIREEWLEEDKSNAQTKRLVAVHRMLSLLRECRNGFDRSKQDSQEVHVRHRKERCQACSGTGMKDGKEDTGEWCEICDGEGEVDTEVTTTVVKGQPGDPRFLRVAQAVMVEMNRLEGLHPRSRGKNQLRQFNTIAGDTLHLHLGSEHERYLHASMDTIIEAKTAMSKLLKEAEKYDSVVEGHVEGKKENGDADDHD